MPKKKTLSDTYVSDRLNVKFSRLISFNRDYLPLIIKYRSLSYKQQYGRLTTSEQQYIDVIHKLFSHSECKIINILRSIKK